MDTVQQVEAQLIMRHYDGFMRKTRIRGRARIGRHRAVCCRVGRLVVGATGERINTDTDQSRGARRAGGRQGHAGRRGCPAARDPEDLDRRYPARRRTVWDRNGSTRQSDHGMPVVWLTTS